MGLFGRIWRVIKGWMLIGVEKAEDPEVILTQAKEEMEQQLAKAKENAVTAIGHRNQLRNMLADQQKRAGDLEANARRALQQGDEELARQLLVEKGNLDATIANLNTQLEQAEQAAASVKDSIRALEGQVRQRAAERLALIAGWKQAQISERLNKALSGVSMENQVQQFDRASEKVRQLQAKADARSELAANDMSGRIASLQSTTTSSEADLALEQMKAELGLAPPTTDQKDEPPQTVRNIEV